MTRWRSSEPMNKPMKRKSALKLGLRTLFGGLLSTAPSDLRFRPILFLPEIRRDELRAVLEDVDRMRGKEISKGKGEGKCTASQKAGRGTVTKDKMTHWICFLDAPKRITNIPCEACHWVRENPWGGERNTKGRKFGRIAEVCDSPEGIQHFCFLLRASRRER